MTDKQQPKAQVASKWTRKYIISEKMWENSEIDITSPSKHVNKSKNQDTTLFAESLSSSKEKPPIDPKDLIDTSQMIYTLSIMCLFGDSQIYANTKMPRFSEFNYHAFHTILIKRVETATRMTEEKFQYESDNAQMTAKDMNKAECLNFDVSDEDKWWKI